MESQKEKINLLLGEYSKKIESAMTEILNAHVDEKNKEIVKYQIFTGGKRLRPALTFITCQLLGGKEKDAIYPAAGLEILHNYSLIVDDIIDNSELRRGKPTAWRKFGKSIASCLAIDYAAGIFEAANKSKKPAEMAVLFSKTLKTIVDGEILDILFERAGRSKEPYIAKNRYKKISQEDFFEMIGKKTAALFEACCQAGGILAEAKEEEIRALGKYGFNMGLAFQIQDDILDIFGDEKSFGKKIGKDIAEKKGGNIIIMLALEKLESKEREKILTIMKKAKIRAGEIAEIMGYVNKTDSLKIARELEQKFAARAKDSLKDLPQNKWHEILEEIINFLITREK
jgi:geranylgeranyl diphosphate synthase, type I